MISLQLDVVKRIVEKIVKDRELERDTHIDVQLGMVSIRVWLTRGMLRGDVREKRKERKGN